MNTDGARAREALAAIYFDWLQGREEIRRELAPFGAVKLKEAATLFDLMDAVIYNVAVAQPAAPPRRGRPTRAAAALAAMIKRRAAARPGRRQTYRDADVAWLEEQVSQCLAQSEAANGQPMTERAALEGIAARVLRERAPGGVKYSQQRQAKKFAQRHQMLLHRRRK